ncbi:MAG: hypothetical protein IT416_03145 [Candidatus Pacebacteria bacterium]|nr:hypothetical protein [Candidatus Paceibacterota bacterium]
MSAEVLNALVCPTCGASVDGPSEGKCKSCGNFLTPKAIEMVVTDETEVKEPVFSMAYHQEIVEDKAKKWGKIIRNAGLVTFFSSFGLHFCNMVTFFSTDVFSPGGALRLVAPFGIAGVGFAATVVGSIMAREKTDLTNSDFSESDESIIERRRRRRRQRRFRN